jgi:hypothetical protein
VNGFLGFLGLIAVVAGSVGLMWLMMRILVAFGNMEGRKGYEETQKLPGRKIGTVILTLFSRKSD